MKLTIKNMVCRHCVDSVRHVLAEQLHLPVVSVELGAAVIDAELSDDMILEIDRALEHEGFELIKSREAEIVDTIKRLLIEASGREAGQRTSIADMLTSAFNLSYASLSRIFSEVEGRSVENYYVSLRIERVKEFIRYRQLSLSEIAYRLGYSSVAHLSRQFKQVTGLTPTQFREMGQRRPLPDV